MEFTVKTDHRMKTKENEKSVKYFARELKSMEHERDEDTIYNWRTWNGF